MESNEDGPTCSRRIKIWTDDETRHLLDKYATNLPEVGPLKQFRTKQDLWKNIAADFNVKSWKQCEERYKTIQKRKKRGEEKNKKLVVKLEKLRPLTPETQISNECVKNKKKTLTETLLEIAARKEESRERRHRERMERADRIEILLQKFVAQNDTTINCINI